MSTAWPAGNGRGGEGSEASAADAFTVRSRGDGERALTVLFGEAGFASTKRPAGNGLGGDGSLAPTL